MDWRKVEDIARAHQIVLVEEAHGILLRFRDANPPEPRAELTEIERLCLQHLADGKRAHNELGIAEHTVKRHLVRAYAKLGVRDQAGAVFAAMRAEIIT